jgi:predicted small integral membrane protein
VDLRWMAWTWPTAGFFLAIIVLLAVFTWLDLERPSVRRRGALGVATTRGDRLFLGLLGAAFAMAAWLAIADGSAAPGAIAAALTLGAALRWA